jgi:5,10-methylenetetrahydromethanopterin reductase
MTGMKFCLHGSARTVREAVERAKRAEALGFEAIFFADSQMGNVDPYQVMAMCAVNTKKIRFGTAVTNMVYRDPTITANSFATLNEISEGRAIIGLGTGDGPVYSLGRTATKLVDFEKGLRTIRDLLHDRGIDVPKSKERAGGNVQLKVGKRPVPMYISAEGPKTLRVAGRICDGVILGTGFDKQVTDWARQRINDGAKEAGRRLEEIDIMPAGMIVVDDDGDLARRRVRSRMANRAIIISALPWKPCPREKQRGSNGSWTTSISPNRSKSASIRTLSPTICSNASPSPARRKNASLK